MIDVAADAGVALDRQFLLEENDKKTVLHTFWRILVSLANENYANETV